MSTSPEEDIYRNPYDIAAALTLQRKLPEWERLVYDAAIGEIVEEFKCPGCDRWHRLKDLAVRKE